MVYFYKKSTLLALSLLPLPGAHCTSTIPPPPFAVPPSTALAHVNMLIGNGGDTPNGSGGTIPSVAPPFGMTRWVAQTQVGYVSATPYNCTGGRVMGVVGTRQPAIWMGESGALGVSANVLLTGDEEGGGGGGGQVVTDFEERGLRVVVGADGTREEVVSVGYYSVLLDDAHGGTILVEQTATSRVAHLRFTFSPSSSSQKTTPYILFEVARPSIITSTPTNVTYPVGGVVLRSRVSSSGSSSPPASSSSASSPDSSSSPPASSPSSPASAASPPPPLANPPLAIQNTELCGYSTERQDAIITPTSSQPFAAHFRAWFCARVTVEVSSASAISSNDGSSSSESSTSSSTKNASNDAPAFEFGFIQNGTRHASPAVDEEITGGLLYAYLMLPSNTDANADANADVKEGVQGGVKKDFKQGVKTGKGTRTVTIRVGTSFISEAQARANIDAEVPDVSSTASTESSSPSPRASSPSDGAHTQTPDGTPAPGPAPSPGTFEHTAYTTRKAWADLLGRVSVDVYDHGDSSEEIGKELEGRDLVDLEVFWTGVVHSVQFPSEQHEQGRYYSAYDNRVHSGESYTGYSIWDTFRAEWAWQILFVPERIPGLVQSMLNDYQEGGWLPMWKNIAETNIMVGTHADSLVAEAVVKGITGFDTEVAWAAVWKDATVPPARDWETVYADREENVDYEVRAGLSSVYDRADGGWVADDVHSESASRTLDYAYDDFAAYTLAVALGKPANITNFLRERAMRAPFTIFNKDTGFMEARNADGSWAGEDRGWTEGDKWAYSFDVVHDMLGLIEARGGAIQFIKSLDEHFDGGHNDHTNEPSHHIPYLYAMTGASYKTQEKVREIAVANYNNTPTGLSGNEDCGQMSAWFIFSALGFYPVNPVSAQYVVGSPFFEKVTLTLHPPGSTSPATLTIRAPGARTNQYIKSLTINGVPVVSPTISHAQIAYGGEVVFEMSDQVERWGNTDEVLREFGVSVGGDDEDAQPARRTHGLRRDEL